MIDEKEIRRIIDCEIAKLEKRLEHEDTCNREKLETVHKSLREEVEHKYNDNKESISKEAEIREQENKNIDIKITHKWEFFRWLISGAFGAMGIMAAAFFWLILSGESNLLVEFCQQGQTISDSSLEISNQLLNYVNNLRETQGLSQIDRFPRNIIPNCHIASTSP